MLRSSYLIHVLSSQESSVITAPTYNTFAEALLISVLQTYQVAPTTRVGVKATATMVVTPATTATTVDIQNHFDAPLNFSPATNDIGELRARAALTDKFRSLFNQVAVARGLTLKS